MNQETIVIVIEDGETHTYRTNRKVNAEIASLIADQKAGVDEMLAEFTREFAIEQADFQKDFGCEANLTAKPRRRRHAPVKNEKLEEIKLGEYRRLGQGRTWK